MNNSQHAFPWVAYFPADGPRDIKVEAQTDNVSLLSPPTSPHLSSSSINSTIVSPVSRRRSSSSVSARTRPYPLLTRVSRSRPNSDSDSDFMAPAAYSLGRGSGKHGERRSSEGDTSIVFAPSGFVNMPFTLDNRPTSSNSSSLMGAMGDAHLAGPSSASSSPHSHARNPGSPSPKGDQMSMIDPQWAAHQGHSMTVASEPRLYPGVAGNVPYPHDTSTALSYGFHGNSPQSSPSSPFINETFITAFTPDAASSFPGASCAGSQDEMGRLRRHVLQLEVQHEQDVARIKAMEAQLMQVGRMQNMGSGLPSPRQSASFMASWKARTDARVKQYCSLNRAGNALCSWHDSRRERRIHPPRMAPEGYLNCGCTFEEALFEESLARHGVGSYHPGESVRMDPSLRNPLLKLLKERYNYRDGDFERDPQTGEWLPGEGPAKWEAMIRVRINPHRPRNDYESR